MCVLGGCRQGRNIWKQQLMWRAAALTFAFECKKVRKTGHKCGIMKDASKSRKVERVHAKCRFLNHSLIPAGSKQTSEPFKQFSQSESLFWSVVLSCLFFIRTMEPYCSVSLLPFSASALVHFSHAKSVILTRQEQAIIVSNGGFPLKAALTFK